jgi:hypothetical protein
MPLIPKQEWVGLEMLLLLLLLSHHRHAFPTFQYRHAVFLLDDYYYYYYYYYYCNPISVVDEKYVRCRRLYLLQDDDGAVYDCWYGAF